MSYVGELAALGTAVLWSCGSLLFAFTSGRIGALATNLVRITLAAVILGLCHLFLRGVPFPTAAPATLAALAVSGVIGLVIGDACYFRALVVIGPRMATLMMALVPVMTAAIGWVLLAERLGARAVAGILVTVAGVAWVVLERAPSGAGQGRLCLGVVLGLGGAAGQAIGLILAKGAMRGLDDPLAATVVRMVAAAVASWVVAAVWRKGGAAGAGAFAGLRDRRVAAALACAAVIGPVGGVWLSLIAVRHTETAIAATLMALVPVMILPLVYVVNGERPSARAIAGAVVAVIGVALTVTR